MEDIDSIFKSVYESKSVETIAHECETGSIDLNAPYQRCVVWNEMQQSAYINSVYRGILPVPLIFNVKIKTDGRSICIDGKQRITSVILFRKNKFSTIIDDEYVYYSEVPKKYHDRKDYRTFTQKDRNRFDNTSIQIVKYSDLLPSDEREIFQRVQFGKKPTQGEIIPSLIQDDNFTEYFKKYCKDRKKYLRKYIKKKSDRGEEVEFISLLIYCLSKETYYFPTKQERDEFISTLKKEELTKITKQLDFMVEHIFGDVLCDDDVEKINKPMLLVIAYQLFRNTYEDYVIDDQMDYQKCISVVNTTLIDCKRQTRRTHECADAIKKSFNRNWKNYKETDD